MCSGSCFDGIGCLRRLRKSEPTLTPTPSAKGNTIGDVFITAAAEAAADSVGPLRATQVECIPPKSHFPVGISMV